MTERLTVGVAPIASAPLARVSTRPRQSLRLNRTLVAGLAVLSVVVAIAVFGPFLSPYPSDEFVADPRLAPSWQHPFGTDNLGRDVATRVVHAAHLNLLIGVVPTMVTVVIGVFLGALAGFYGGWIDTLIMRLVDIVVAFPFLVLVIAIVAMLGPGVRNLFVGIARVGWVSYARIIRGEILVAKHQEYVVAARTLGCSDRRIVARHVMPNVVAVALVYSMSDIVLNILLGAALSFLGLGVQPPTPEWGSMIQEARNFIRQAWWMPTFPGLAIIVTGIGFSLLGDGLAERLQPGR